MCIGLPRRTARSLCANLQALGRCQWAGWQALREANDQGPQGKHSHCLHLDAVSLGFQSHAITGRYLSRPVGLPAVCIRHAMTYAARVVKTEMRLGRTRRRCLSLWHKVSECTARLSDRNFGPIAGDLRIIRRKYGS